MSGQRRTLRATRSAADVIDHEDDRAHDHGQVDHGQVDHGQVDHGQVDHGQVDHGQVDHGQVDHHGADEAVAEATHSEAGSSAPDEPRRGRRRRAARQTQKEQAHAEEESAPDRASPSRPALSGRIRALFDEQVSQSRDESFHQASMELQQFMEPARQQLLLNVPGSSSPEEAEAMLNHQAAIELDKPVTISPDSVIDLRNPPAMGAYPPAEKLSNRVLRLADRHWAKDKPRPSADIVAEKSAIADLDFAQKPAGTQRCYSQRGEIRCRGVFAFRSDQQQDGAPIACPTCGTSHRWDAEEETWVVDNDTALTAGRRRGVIASSS